MAKFTFNMPDVGEGVAEAEIVEWFVKVGDRVEEDQHLVDVMTDKATIDIESPVEGTVIEVAGELGDTIAVGSMLLVVEVEGEVSGDAEAEEPAPEPEPEPEPELKEPTPSPARAEPVEAPSSSSDEPEQKQDSPSTGSGRAVSENKVLASPAVRKRA
ncbi:MAG: biotin/lipoyl-containing protein, partial [Erythrobacter sp.]